MKRRRVKITGIGPVTPAGTGKESFWSGILEPISRVALVSRFPPTAGPFVAAEVPDFRIEEFTTEVDPKRTPRHTQFAIAAALLALADAGVTPGQLRETGAAILIGAALMDFGSINRLFDLTLRSGKVTGLPTAVPSILASSIGAAIADLIGGMSRAVILQSACCAGIDSIGESANLVARGEVDFALCGGTEAPVFLHPMLELKLAGLAGGNPEAPERQSRPFDLWRTTGVIGEGACVLLLEPESSPRPGYGFVDGHAAISDSSGNICEGMVPSMRFALANARMAPDEVESISAWGPGHKLIDVAEAQALREVFGNNVSEIPAVSIKGAIGNPFAAAGAIQVATAALGMTEGVMPPTVNWEFRDPACDLCLSSHVRAIAHRTALVSAHGLSANNAALVLRR